MAMRIKLISIAASEDSKGLVKLVQSSKNGPEVDWEEVISGYSRKELDHLWENFQKMGTSVILGLDKIDDNNEEELDLVFQSLHSLVILAKATVASNTVQIPPSLLDMSILFHDLLPSLPSRKEKLKDEFCSLFEIFWIKGKPGREDLIDNTLLYLFEMNMRPKATMKMIKRLWQLHEGYHLIKYDDPSSQNLRDQICQSLVNPVFMKRDEGVRIIGTILPLNIEFMKTCHEIIKKNLVNISRNVIPKYGEVYFRAWQLSNEQIRPKFETNCLQDLMYHAIHVSGIQLVKNLRKMLAYIHRQKRKKGVDEMLNRLYAPILWRSLKAANSVVRLNAVFLLFDIFPLQNPLVGVEENNNLLQNQFNTFDNLLMDSCPSIRSRSILGVCQILSAYWQMIPKEVIRTYVTTLIEDLAWDGAAAEVRESVLKGIMLLLDCHYCHLILQPILPQLQNLFHDNSEKVRIAMVNLLIKVKGIRKVKYWSVVSVEHLLVRLAIDTQPVARRIMQIIFSSFLPVDKPAEVQVTRIICLIETNPKASRIFFQHAPKHLTLEQVVSFIVLLCGCILRSVRNEKAANEESFQENDSQKDESSTIPEPDDENYSLSLEMNVVHGFLDAITILWTVIEPELAKPSSKIMKEKMDKIFSKAIPVIMRRYKDLKSNSALMIISGKLPPRMVPYLSHQCIARLKKLDEESVSKNEYSALIEMTCSWGKMNGLLDLILEWLTDGMKSKLDSSCTSKHSKKQTQVRFSVNEVPKPILAIKFLFYVVEQPNCRALLLNKHQSNILDILGQLKYALKLLEHRFDTANQTPEFTDDKFLLDAYFLYIRLNLLIYTEAESQDKDIVDLHQMIYQFLSWAKKKVMNVLENKQNLSRSIRKRNASHDNMKTIDLACDLLQHLFTLVHTYLLMHEINEQFCIQLGILFELCIDSDKGVKLLPIILKCLVQLTNKTPEQKLVLRQALNISGCIMNSMAKCSLSENNGESLTKILTSSRMHMSNFLAALFDLRLHSASILAEFYKQMVVAVIYELTESSKMGDLDQVPDVYQDLKPFTLWLLGIIFKKISSVSYFFQELQKYIKTDCLNEQHQINSILFMLNALLKKPKFPKSEIKECWTALQNCSSFPKQTDLDDTSDNVGLKLSLKEHIDHLRSVMMEK